MPVRIYALAKDLRVDSKKLVDLCAQAGIADKGSALASLTDDEATKVKAFISGGGKGSGGSKPSPAAAPQEPGVLRREDYVAPTAGGKVRDLGDAQKPEGVIQRTNAKR